MGLAAIALGSNLPSHFGGREATLREAVRRLEALGDVLRVSSFFDTAPEIFTEQPRFLNAVALLRTGLEPEPLLQSLLDVEAAMGRERAGVPEKGPRIIDLDLLLLDGLERDTAFLRLPHPGLPQRRFVLEPLLQVAPEWVHPSLGLTVAEMLARLEPAGQEPLP